MRLNSKKILKTWDELDDKSGYINRMHTTGLAPYNMDMMFAEDRAKVFTGMVDKLIAKHNWIPIGEESSQTLMRKIRDAKSSPKNYAMMIIDDTLYDTRLIYEYIRHYQRANDVIHIFKMTDVGEIDAPIVLTTNEEWYCIIAPRTESKDSAEVLFKIQENDDEIEDMNFELTFNPITGVME